MTQIYTDKSRETEEHALPNAEVFFMSYREFVTAENYTWMGEMMQEGQRDGFSNFQTASDLKGWYWWACFQGCLPDGDPIGPFETEQEAIDDAQEG